MHILRLAFFAALMIFVASFHAAADEPKTFNQAIDGLEVKDGLLPVYLDHAKGRVLFKLPPADENSGITASLIYVEYLRAGLGSNPVGLDRAQDGSEQIVHFRRLGDKIFIEAVNTRFIASAENPLERLAVEQSFASSILWSGRIEAEAADGSLLLDMSEFLLRDAHGVAAQLKAAEQGKFKLAPKLSAVDAGASLVFPENLELESLLTFTSSEPGPEVRVTTPAPENLTLRTHHSFIKLPPPGYRTRADDQRAGVISIAIADYSAPLDQPLVKRLAVRHRLQKINPGPAPSRVKAPIVYYVDPGAPEPVRSALIEGASWWAEAFEAAGFIDAYRVEVLPKGAHPLDARYNMINWVHRQTRGWSYGSSVLDPRTGEILKGNVVLGSLRVRQDRMIIEGLVGVQDSGKGGPNDPVEVALARIRQLAAHEVGHTLGFLHNMAASTYGGRASVMDYPAPQITIRPNGTLDLSDAYGVGVGAWDKFAVQYLYAETPPEPDEAGALEAIVKKAIADNLVYVGDADARPAGSGHPLGNLWDTGEEPVASLENVMEVRRLALENFGLGNIQKGQPVAQLQEVIVPIYLFHRYQVEAATKPLAGLYFGYPSNGDGLSGSRIAVPDYQRRALAAVLATLEPSVLDLPDRTLDLLSPRHVNFGQGQYSREMFRSRTYPAFDLMGAADVAAAITLRHLLHPARLSRLVEFHRRDPANPSLEEVLAAVDRSLFGAPKNEGGRLGELRFVVQNRLVSQLIRLVDDPALITTGQSRIRQYLSDLSRRLNRRARRADPPMAAHFGDLAARIEALLNRLAPAAEAGSPQRPVPPGSPIGGVTGECWLCLTDERSR
jgi:hypothetical protein